MKIVNRNDFLLFPSGIVYARIKEGVPGKIFIKGETLQGEWMKDWFCLDIVLASAGIDPLDSMECRDGMFDSEDQFAIFSELEIKSMIEILQEALQERRG